MVAQLLISWLVNKVCISLLLYHLHLPLRRCLRILQVMANIVSGVVVTLTPVYSPDTLPFRSLTFLSDNDTVPIGRASKSETKNLVPNHDNGWFDSRVMSREHGVIGVKMEDRVSI